MRTLSKGRFLINRQICVNFLKQFEDDTLTSVRSVPPSVEFVGYTTPLFFQTRTHDKRVFKPDWSPWLCTRIQKHEQWYAIRAPLNRSWSYRIRLLRGLRLSAVCHSRSAWQHIYAFVWLVSNATEYYEVLTELWLTACTCQQVCAVNSIMIDSTTNPVQNEDVS